MDGPSDFEQLRCRTRSSINITLGGGIKFGSREKKKKKAESCRVQVAEAPAGGELQFPACSGCTLSPFSDSQLGSRLLTSFSFDLRGSLPVAVIAA